MSTRVSAIPVVLFLLCFSTNAVADDTAEKRRLIETVMEQVKVRTLVEQQIEALVASIQSMAPKIVVEAGVAPARRDAASRIVATEFGNLKSKMIDLTLENTAQAYSSAFSISELRELVSFYRTTTGVKLTNDLPRLQAEGIQRGRQQGEKMSQEAMCSAFAKLKAQNIVTAAPPYCR